MKTVTCFLKSGVPLCKLDIFRGLLEENGLSLTSSQHLRETIPAILANEKNDIREQIEGQEIAIIYDSKTYMAEALTLSVRFVDDDWNIK